MLWTKDNRTNIVEDHFGGVNPKASEVTKKASTIWNSLSEEEKKPWVEKYIWMMWSKVLQRILREFLMLV